MTILRAQASKGTSHTAGSNSHSSRGEFRRVSPPRGRKAHALLRACSQREVLSRQQAPFGGNVEHSKRKESPAGQTSSPKEIWQGAETGQRGGLWGHAAAATLAPLLLAAPAWAYSAAEGEKVLKNVAGAAYIILVCFFFYRLFRKRAYSGATQSFRSQANEVAEELEEEEPVKPEAIKDATPLTALWGALQAGVICYCLFQLCGLIDGYFDRQEMPDQYTAHNITVTLRTVVRGLAYLMTFLFGANCVGLSGLAIQLAFFPEIGSQEDVKQE